MSVSIDEVFVDLSYVHGMVDGLIHVLRSDVNHSDSSDSLEWLYEKLADLQDVLITQDYLDVNELKKCSVFVQNLSNIRKDMYVGLVESIVNRLDLLILDGSNAMIDSIRNEQLMQ